MRQAIAVRTDFTADEVRQLAKRARNATQGRRLMAIAAVLDGASREDAARIGGAERQTLRQWVTPTFTTFRHDCRSASNCGTETISTSVGSSPLLLASRSRTPLSTPRLLTIPVSASRCAMESLLFGSTRPNRNELRATKKQPASLRPTRRPTMRPDIRYAAVVCGASTESPLYFNRLYPRPPRLCGAAH
jgi:hypothetical protein